MTIIKLWGVWLSFNLVFREEEVKGGVAMVAQAVVRCVRGDESVRSVFAVLRGAMVGQVC